MHTRGLFVAAMMIVATACGGGSPSSPPAAEPVATPAAATGTAPPLSPSAAAGTSTIPFATEPAPAGGAIDASRLPTLEPAVVCSLLTEAEAADVLGKPLHKTPDGSSLEGMGTNCIYQTGESRERGTYIKVEFNTFGFEVQNGLIGAGAQSLMIAGLPAVGAEADPSTTFGDARISVQVSSAPTDPALWIEAPTLAAAQAVAESVLSRLDGVTS